MAEGTTPAALLIADISGYTKFVRLHAMSVSHAQEVTARLLTTLVQTATPPLEVVEIEGDAVFFFAPAEADTLKSVLDQVKTQVPALFKAFTDEVAAASAVRSCPCDACATVGELRLKQVLHSGEVGIQRIDRFAKPFGLDVILAHRLLKNEVESDEYLLLTDAVYGEGDGFFGLEPDRLVQQFEGVGAVGLNVFYQPELAELPVVHSATPTSSTLRTTFWKMWMQVRTLLSRYRVQGST